MKATVSYYTMTDQPTPDCPGALALTKNSKIFYSLHSKLSSERDEDGLKATQTQIAATIPADLWCSDFLKVIWVMKWNVSGLSPVRPVVVLKRELCVKSKHGVKVGCPSK